MPLLKMNTPKKYACLRRICLKMKIWNYTVKNKVQSLSSSRSNIYNRVLALLLVITLLGSSLSGIAVAAEEVVTSLDINSSSSTNKLIVEDGSIVLTAMASISGVAAQRNVTDDATWSSSSTSIKVSKGVLTATSAVSSATITAKYKTVTQTITVSAEFLYDEIKLKPITPASSGDSPDTLSVDLGTELKFGAAGVKASQTDVDIASSSQWTTSNSAVATVSGGTVTLLTAGSATITVKHKGKSDYITLTVASPYNSIEINQAGPIEIYVGNTNQLTATADVKVGSDHPVTDEAAWTTSNAAIVKVDKGLVTPVGPGSAIVTVKRFGVTDSVTFIVRTEYEAIQVTPDKAITLTLYGAPVELSATVTKGTTTPIPVTLDAEWKVSDPLVASIKTEGSRKLLEPKGVGTTKVTVTYKGLTKEIVVTIFPTISTVEITKSEMDIFVDETGVMPEVSGITTAGATQDISKLVSWTSSDEAIVSIEDGKWKALKKGTVTLTAVAENELGVTRTDTIVVVVHKKILALISDTDSISVVIGKEVNLPAVQIIYEDGEEEAITDQITWKSSTANLLIKPGKMKGLLAASATLTGTYLNKTVKIKVQVEEEFTSFQITPTKVSLTLNKSESIKVIGITKSGKKVTLSSRIDWNASSPDHVTIKGSSVKGAEEGSGKLTAIVQGKTLEIPYVVTAKLTKLTASSTSFKPTVGEQLSVELSAQYENGKTAKVTDQAVWTTSKSSVATVIDGKIKVAGKGSATIKAVFGGKTVTVKVSVKG